jgi:hypothetical protein
MAKYGVVEPTEAEQANPKLTQKTPEQKTAQALDALKPNKPEEPK